MPMNSVPERSFPLDRLIEAQYDGLTNPYSFANHEIRRFDFIPGDVLPGGEMNRGPDSWTVEGDISKGISQYRQIFQGDRKYSKSVKRHTQDKKGASAKNTGYKNEDSPTYFVCEICHGRQLAKLE